VAALDGSDEVVEFPAKRLQVTCQFGVNLLIAEGAGTVELIEVITGFVTR
jgi:hypothetical protein